MPPIHRFIERATANADLCLILAGILIGLALVICAEVMWRATL